MSPTAPNRLPTGAWAVDPLTRAAMFAGRAPSLHNSQPWRWFIGDDVLDLTLEPGRVLAYSDPDGRFATLSCGAALHHARIHLAAHGWQVAVDRVPPSSSADLLARLRLDGSAPADPAAQRLIQAAERRRTDRRIVAGSPVDEVKLRVIEAAVHDQGAELTAVRPDQLAVLVEAAERALGVEAADPGLAGRGGRLGGRRAPRRYGHSHGGVPPDPSVLTAPAHALRRAATALLTETDRGSAVFAVLHGPGDEPRDWLIAGEALSAGWLAAAELGVSVLPLSIMLEVAGGRDMVRRLLGWTGRPYLVLRLATVPATDSGIPRTPRLSPEQIIHRR